MKLSSYLNDKKRIIDEYLNELMPSVRCYPPIIHEAMRYSIFPGGKRIRPILLLACTEAVGKITKDAIYAACAVEIVHNYSLIHDDLPCMDNAHSRRGKPALHKKFDETIALLCGDAMQALGFRALASALSEVKDKKKCKLIFEEFADAIGSHGMIGGQVAEYVLRDKEKTLPDIQYVYTHKTGALIAHSIRMGAYFAGASKRVINKVFRFGEYLGFCYQIIDDIVDKDGYVLTVGPKEAQEEAERIFELAKKEVSFLGDKGQPLIELGEYLLDKKMRSK